MPRGGHSATRAGSCSANKGLDGIFLPAHPNRFFQAERLQIFVSCDFMNSPDLGNDFRRFSQQLEQEF